MVWQVNVTWGYRHVKLCHVKLRIVELWSGTAVLSSVLVSYREVAFWRSSVWLGGVLVSSR